ncbi:MAG: TonB-dependent receptor, partial [Novosphingobium sp.]
MTPKKWLLAFTSLTTLISAQAVQAQTTAPAAEEANNGDIIVTARRREETLLNVPLSVTALSQSALTAKGISSALDLGSTVPSLTITTAGGFRSFLAYSIRGQRTGETQLLTDPPVGLYFAEVNQPRTLGFGTAFFDLESLQVLKGVQGTLFGRNNTGGAVLVTPAAPKKDFDASIKGQYGNYNMADVEGMINVPLEGIGALRVAGKYHRRDGFMIDQTNGRDYSNQNYYALRGSLLLEPSSSISNLTIVDYVNSDDHGTGLVGDFSQATGALGAYGLINLAYGGAFGGTPNTPGNVIPNSPAFGSFAGKTVYTPVTNVAAQIAAQAAIRNSSNPYRILGTTIGTGGTFDLPNAARTGANTAGNFSFEKVNNLGITNKTTFDLGGAKLKNIFGYRKIKSQVYGDLDGLPGNFISSNQYKDIQEYSEELQLQGNAFDNKLEYTTGLFYFVEKGRDGSVSAQFPELSTAFGVPAIAGFLLTGNRGYGTATSYAAYGAITYSLSDQFKFSGGLRYTHDKRSVNAAAIVSKITSGLQFPQCTFDLKGLDNVAGTADDLTILPDCTVHTEKSWEALTYDATLQWQPNTSTSAYASFRKGFRAGGYSLRASNAATLQPFEPETVYEYELGLKNRAEMGGGVLTTSAAVFYQDYRNVQVQNPAVINGLVATVIQNVAKERILGGELEANLRVENFDFGVNYAYVDVKVLKTSPALASTFGQIGIPKHQVNVNAAWH